MEEMKLQHYRIFFQKQVNLGLDLQGGSHLLLEVNESVLKEESENLVDEISIFRKAKLNIQILVQRLQGSSYY